jgi:uncharacterized cofD-like protein
MVGILKSLEWLKPGLKLKRWLFLQVIAVVFWGYGIALLISQKNPNTHSVGIAACYIGVGMVLIAISIFYIIKTVMNVVNESGLNSFADAQNLRSLLIDKKILERGPSIVVVGGGTGLSTMLRGLKTFTSNITAVVTVSDDGGSSGTLREDLGILPPGDIRNCILALARTEPILEKLLQYRFTEGRLKNQNFGNLFLAAMTRVCGSFEKAVKTMSDVLAVTGVVLPVSLEDIKLCAELEDKTIVIGESKVESKLKKSAIKRVFIQPENAKAFPEVIEAIKEADAIILGPGSLYTSIIPNLLVNGVVRAIRNSRATKIYVSNIMTQPGETDNYSVYDHIRAIEEHGGRGCINFCIVNSGKVSADVVEKYIEDGAQKVEIDEKKIQRNGIKLIKEDVINIEKGFVRHNSAKLGEAIEKIICNQSGQKRKRAYIRKKVSIDKSISI